MATLDILTPAEAKQAINVSASNTAVESKLAAVLSGICEQIDNLCGPVVARQVVRTYHGGRPYILLRDTPVLSVDEVVETTGTSPTTLTSDDYLLETDGHYAALHRWRTGYRIAWITGAFNVAITTTVGRYATTDAVSAGWKQVAASILRVQWQQEAGEWATRPAAFDDLENVTPGFVSVEDMLRRRMPRELLPAGVA